MNRRAFLVAAGATAGAGTAVEARLVRRVTATAERFPFGLRFNDLGDLSERYASAADLDPKPRGVVASAVDGGYETRAVPDWLRRFLAGTRFVRYEGALYRLDRSIPEYVVRPEVVPEGAADGPVASAEAYEDARTSDWGVSCGVTCARDGDGGGYETVRTAWLRPEMRALLREYEYVRYGGEVVRVPLTVDDPGAPYAVTARPVDDAAVFGGPVFDLSDAPAAHRETLREAAEATGASHGSDLPDSLVARLRDAEYLRVDGTYYTTYVSDVRSIPLEVEVRMRDPRLAPFDPAAVALTLRNAGDRPVEVLSGEPMPFSVLSVRRAGDPETERTVWSDAYRETGHVSTLGRRVVAVTGAGATATLEPGESLTTTYELGGVGRGTWVIADSVGAGFADRTRESGADDAGGDSDGGDTGDDADAVGNGDVPFRVRFEVA